MSIWYINKIISLVCRRQFTSPISSAVDDRHKSKIQDKGMEYKHCKNPTGNGPYLDFPVKYFDEMITLCQVKVGIHSREMYDCATYFPINLKNDNFLAIYYIGYA